MPAPLVAAPAMAGSSRLTKCNVVSSSLVYGMKQIASARPLASISISTKLVLGHSIVLG